ncbi:MAG: hypothetical protein ABR613_06965 [Actinomycetota bacterium]
MSCSHRRGAALGAAVLLLGGGVLAGVQASPPDAPALRPGQARFWKGSAVESTTSYPFAIAPGGARLRAAVDHPATSNAFDVQLVTPSGTRIAAHDHELFVDDPEPGVWEIAAVRRDSSAQAFRLRAKLEREPRVAEGLPMLPNLRAEPGYDFTFSYPEAACELVGSGCSFAPVPPFCAPDEAAEDRALRCLRFSFGYQNAGRGAMDLRFGELDPVARSVPVRQRVYLADATPLDYSDNDFVERDAGTATYHEVHGHFHYDNVFGAKLLKVVDERTGALEPVAEVAKRGACAHDIAFVDFDRFFQEPQHLADSGDDCNFTFTNPTSPAIRIGLSAGWGDIYTAGLSDNYVDFGLNADGLYVVQVKADVDDTLAESNQKDNFAYSLIRVSGLSVELLERGRGRSPWDGKKVVVRGLGD